MKRRNEHSNQRDTMRGTAKGVRVVKNVSKRTPTVVVDDANVKSITRKRRSSLGELAVKTRPSKASNSAVGNERTHASLLPHPRTWHLGARVKALSENTTSTLRAADLFTSEVFPLLCRNCKTPLTQKTAQIFSFEFECIDRKKCKTTWKASIK